MCGIAGYSLDAESGVDRTLAAQALLAGIAERGADAVGYAHSGAGSRVTIHKQRSGATALLDAVELPPDDDRRARSRARLHEGPSHRPREQPSDPPRIRGRHPQRDHRQRRGDLRAPRHRPRRARDDGRLRGDLRPHARRRGRITPRSRSFAARWRPPGSTSVRRTGCTSPAGSPAHSGSGAHAASSSSPRRRPRSRSSREPCG